MYVWLSCICYTVFDFIVTYKSNFIWEFFDNLCREINAKRSDLLISDIIKAIFYKSCCTSGMIGWWWYKMVEIN